jgi:hypothetical protein
MTWRAEVVVVDMGASEDVVGTVSSKKTPEVPDL